MIGRGNNCKKVMDIMLEKRPKWLNDERLYNLACSALPNERKCPILDALTNHNEREVKALQIPKSKFYPRASNHCIAFFCLCLMSSYLYVGDIVEYCLWLRREVIWHKIVEASQEIVAEFEKIYEIKLSDTFSTKTLDHKRLHYGLLYEDLCDTIKFKAKIKRDKVIELAAKRAVYR